MMSVTILYPKSEGSTFDIDYYTSTHMPMFAEALGDACKGWGVSAINGDKYHCLGWALVESADAFGAAMKENGGPVMADVANFTNIQPEMLMGDVVV